MSTPSPAGGESRLRRPTAIGARIRQEDEQLRNGQDYDHSFVFDKGGKAGELTLAARVHEVRAFEARTAAKVAG
ncbi:hypothetical protein JRI60_14560 [Archangium violaceum]|uniref:hypothetical protein n=1 Tax=Archangium violaceum TaxID=83451 RepID=UPI00194DC118|nr:hypothetical protein [Archangium violaceum]QRO00146.1 hypothetical protein JRI60_14560 [Archangium violaceum]